MRIEQVGMEPMIKNFESAGAGCAPICDHVSELDDLGFVDGESMIAYNSFDDLIERLDHYLVRPEEMARIGHNACVLAHSRHSWLHRARQFNDTLRSL
jgi:spore maturation protein CgeB